MSCVIALLLVRERCFQKCVIMPKQRLGNRLVFSQEIQKLLIHHRVDVRFEMIRIVIMFLAIVISRPNHVQEWCKFSLQNPIMTRP